jgi:hypothetical protein
MSKLGCICGEELSDGMSPCRQKLQLTTDVRLEDVAGWEDGQALYRADQLRFMEVWTCRQCGAIGVEIQEVFHWFRPVEEAFRIVDAIEAAEALGL